MKRHIGSKVSEYSVNFRATKRGIDHKRYFKGLANKQVREFAKSEVEFQLNEIERADEYQRIEESEAMELAWEVEYYVKYGFMDDEDDLYSLMED